MWNDLVQELRVAQAGVQIIFGVLIIAVFQPVFGDLAGTDRALYVAAVCTGAACVGALLGPVASHRLLVGRGIKPQAVALASCLIKAGLVLLIATIALTLLLLLRVGFGSTLGAWLTALMTVGLIFLWVVLPLWVRRHYTRR
jgi:hypothetical protein